jgi:hypothetical protein
MNKGRETEDHIRALIHTLGGVKELDREEIKSELCENENGDKPQEGTHEERLSRDRDGIHNILTVKES